MSLDDKIKQALKMDESEVEQVLQQETGIFSRILGVFRGSMRGWNIFGFILSFVSAGFMFWCGYHFFINDATDNKLVWGVAFLSFLIGTMVTKIWFWMEMNRYATSREIKRLELAIAQLTEKLSHKK